MTQFVFTESKQFWITCSKRKEKRLDERWNKRWKESNFGHFTKAIVSQNVNKWTTLGQCFQAEATYHKEVLELQYLYLLSNFTS